MNKWTSILKELVKKPTHSVKSHRIMHLIYLRINLRRLHVHSVGAGGKGEFIRMTWVVSLERLSGIWILRHFGHLMESLKCQHWMEKLGFFFVIMLQVQITWSGELSPRLRALFLHMSELGISVAAGAEVIRKRPPSFTWLPQSTACSLPASCKRCLTCSKYPSLWGLELSWFNIFIECHLFFHSLIFLLSRGPLSVLSSFILHLLATWDSRKKLLHASFHRCIWPDLLSQVNLTLDNRVPRPLLSSTRCKGEVIISLFWI